MSVTGKEFVTARGGPWCRRWQANQIMPVLAALLAAVNKALSALQAAGTLASLGQAAGLTYLPPREPAILGDIWLKVLQK